MRATTWVLRSGAPKLSRRGDLAHRTAPVGHRPREGLQWPPSRGSGLRLGRLSSAEHRPPTTNHQQRTVAP
eukprot:13274166-Alexandrium_andersonii.AAC.1